MFTTLLQIWIPLISLIILTIGNGLFTTFLSLRLYNDQAANLIIGAMSTVYYAGMVFGSFRVGRTVLSSGHIRTYAAFASLTAVITILHGLFPNAWFWLLLRFLGGYCMAALFVVIESWVLNRSTAMTRGQILSFYMIAIYAAQAIGQFLINIGPITSLIPFSIAAILASLSVVPLAIARVESPQFLEPSILTVKQLYQISPSGIFGCFVAGLVLGGIYGLLPVYTASLGYANEIISWMMGMTILGGMALQFPVGRLSDYVPRRLVMLAVGICFIASTALLMSMNATHTYMIIMMMFFWGGFAFTLYPLSISHVCDYLQADDVVSATQGLLLAYGLGATIGPTIAALFMRILGAQGLMVFFLSTVSCLMLLILWRKTQKTATSVEEQQEFISIPTNATPVISELDPRSDEDILQHEKQQTE